MKLTVQAGADQMFHQMRIVRCIALGTALLGGCGILKVNGKTVGGGSGGGGASSGSGGSEASGGSEPGWGGTTTVANVEQTAKVVPRCPDGKKFFLGAPEQYPGHGVASVAVADMNGDGKADIVTGNPSGDKPAPPHLSNVGVMLGNGDGTFANMKLSGIGANGVPRLISADQISLGDLNGDGKPEMVMSAPGFGGSDPQYAPNNGDGTFAETEPLTTNGAGIGGVALVADFNGDKKTDIAIENYVWLNGGRKGTAKFSGKVAFNDKWDRGSQAAADFDGDGSIDIVTTLEGVTIYNNDGNGTFTKGATYPVSDVGSIRTGDFNGDGKPDIAVKAKSLAILMNKGDGSFAAPVFYKFPDSWDSSYWMVVSDLNNDARFDVVVADPYKGVAVYMNNGKGAFGQAITLPAGKAYQVAAGDFTGAGVKSLVVVDNSQSSDESKSNIYVLHASCR